MVAVSLFDALTRRPNTQVHTLSGWYAIFVARVTVSSMKTLILDMSSLDFYCDETLQVFKVSSQDLGDLVSIPYSSEWSDREAIYQGLNAVLANAVLPTITGLWVKVSLYNPISYQVAVGSVPETRVYSAGFPVNIPEAGATGIVDDECIQLDGCVLEYVVPGVRSTRYAFESHARTGYADLMSTRV